MTTASTTEVPAGRPQTAVGEGRSTGELIDAASASVAEKTAALSEQARCLSAATGSYVRHNPWAIVGLAATAGLIVGVLLGRR